MKRNKNKSDYADHVVWFTISLVGMLLLTALIPEHEVFGIKIKRADITGMMFNHSYATDIPQDFPMPLGASVVDGSVIESTAQYLYETSEQMPINNFVSNEPRTELNVSEGYEHEAEIIEPTKSDTTIATPAGVTPLEDYTAERNGLQKFFNAARKADSLERAVRISFYGDSFIEADIFTMDIREQLQDKYGGGGVGYMPMASNVAPMRKSVRQEFKGIKSVSMVGQRKPQSEMRKIYAMSGAYFVPAEGSEVTYKAVKTKKHLEDYDLARLIFRNTLSTKVQVTVNDTIVSYYSLSPSTAIQQLVVKGNIKSIKFQFTNVAGFIGYGAYLEDEKGILVDNYSLRGSSGVNITSSGNDINRQINDMVKSDMIVLQYGLNVVWEDATNYEYYYKRLKYVVDHIRAYDPDATILIMGVSDRCTRQNGKMVTMLGIKNMMQLQRRVAKEMGCIFWDTRQAMGGDGGMNKFVQNGWAAKDYTHINYKGGESIAKSFVDALSFEESKYMRTSVKEEAL